MRTFSTYVWAAAIIVAAIALGAYFVHRARRLGGPSRPPVGPRERLSRALEDMRLKGIATPEELSAQTEAAEELAVPPPDIPGFPQTPADLRADPGRGARRGRGRHRSNRPAHRRRRCPGDHSGQGT